MDLAESTKALLQVWKERDIQMTVLTSLTVQLFLLFTGDLRRRRISGLLRSIIWLAYVGADPVAIYAIGLFTEETHNLRREQSSGDQTLRLLWAPFLLLHLGGQDTITAFSIEDNNLWLRHLLNLVLQVTLTLYVLWKSFEKLEVQLLAIAIPIFVAGTIKYGERTWALYNGSRDYLGSGYEREEKPRRDYRSTHCGDVMATYALNTVLRVRGLLVGRTLFQLGWESQKELVGDFAVHGQREGKLKIVMVELGMMYDLLYTKAVVLQSRIGRILRCFAEMCMVVAFVLFVANPRLHAHHSRANIVITYTLFVGAMFMESCSVSMVIVSVWTRAGSKKGSFLYWLSCSASSLWNAVMRRFQTNQQQQPSMGQFNLVDYSIYEKCMPSLISKVITALGLEKKWRNIWHVHHIKVDNEMSNYIETLLCSGVGSQRLNLGREMNYVLRAPFEHALFRLHIFTDMHLSRVDLPGDEETAQLAAECRKLSQYLIYLMAVYPSLLPVSNAAQDLEHFYVKWVRDNTGSNTMRKQEILNKYATEKLYNEEAYSRSPFELLPPSAESLRVIKEVWARLLIYAAAKCPVELHARQLSDGLELLTVVWLLMLHHGAGDVGWREVDLVASDDSAMPTAEALVPCQGSNWIRRQPRHLYAFEFQQTQEATAFVASWAPLLPADGVDLTEDILQGVMFGSLQPAVPSSPTNNSTETTSEIEETTSETEQDGHVERGKEHAVDVPPEIEHKGK
ncbi:hypothetical protein CFC21_054531 [Triticum aestivum]|uniref:DUF4220 domain-containing protein n=3 Tax=Triticum TaxID=4564 RepID=A0A9R0SNP8_TRITD|nr:uncharacterized protein LOC123082894 [Triticum aestivum]KAF7045422.1 hypothetical protein CFC21_054531 [Triticum aestivum]VAH98525.1 unnamed protein product [Triticum turgidum subsp. durum]